MRTAMRAARTDIIAQNRVFGWIALATALVLLIPLVAMQLTNDVNWRPNDFVAAGGLIFITGSVFVLAARRVRHRALLALGVAAALFYLWAELAVGVFTGLGS
jgi:hypothetical protein